MLVAAEVEFVSCEEIARGGVSVPAAVVLGVSAGGVLVFVLLVAAAPAYANWEQVGPFCTESCGARGAAAAAVDDHTGELYVGSTGSKNVVRESAEGVKLGEWATLGEVVGVAVDQATGDVYVLNQGLGVGTPGVVQVFKPEGEEVAQFGENSEESVSDAPEKIGPRPRVDGIAVSSAGVVYLSDDDNSGGRVLAESLVVVFEPVTAGDYEHYGYAGELAGSVGKQPEVLAVDGAGDLFVMGTEKYVYEYPSAGGGAPVGLGAGVACEYVSPVGHLEGLTVVAGSGDVFTSGPGAGTTVFHVLSREPSCGETGRFTEEEESFKPTEKSQQVRGLAFSPEVVWEGVGGGRPVGVLY
ncbi:MAG: hypothetical protein ACLPUT_09940, partial [Solirubrobacteraceae bacterium]